MAFVAIAPLALWLPETPFFTVYANALLDATGEKAAWIVAAPKTGTIDRVSFRSGTFTTGDTVDVRLETIDATTGDPSGTLLGANSNGAQAVAAANTWHETTLTTPVAVTRGDRFAVVVVQGAVGNFHVVRSNPAVAAAIPYCDLFTSGSWVKSGTNAPVGAIRYNDTTYAQIGGLFPCDTLTTTNYGNASTPDERGNVITMPFACKVAGIWTVGGNQVGDFTVLLRDSGGTLLGSKAIDGDAQATGITTPLRIPIDTEVTLAAGDVVRVTKRPDTATSTTMIDSTCPTGMSAALAGGGAAVHTQRTDGGAWTDTANKMAAIGLIVSALSDNIGAGGSSAFAYGYA